MDEQKMSEVEGVTTETSKTENVNNEREKNRMEIKKSIQAL
jgi:hypothetical protein